MAVGKNERRRQTRFKKRKVIAMARRRMLFLKGKPFKAQTLDVSMTGARLALPETEDLAAGEKVTVRIQEDDYNVPRDIPAVVQWVRSMKTPQGAFKVAGVKFASVTPDLETFLKRVIAMWPG